MITLGLDTSTEAFSVAIKQADNLLEHFEIAPRQHGNKLLSVIDQLLADIGATMADVSQIVYGRGPGAFTGVRIAVSAAQGLAFGANCPMIGVSSLQNLALQAFEKTDAQVALVAMDARMGEVYFAAFKACRTTSETGIWPELIMQEQVIAPEKLEKLNFDSEGKVVAIGSGWQVYGENLSNRLELTPDILNTDAFPLASYAIKLAQFAALQREAHAPEQAVPVYLRNKVAQKPQSLA
jgi:tRNA threonylcarbamoyladenosine biosynthesis protein TsaB